MKKGYKKCPFCANEIKEGAIKCEFCESFLDGRERNKKSKKNNQQNNNYKYIRIILGIILVLLIIFGIFKLKNNKETRQGFYYADVLQDGKEIGGPIFDNYDACKDWAVDKYLKGQDAFCSTNCHDSVDGTPICKNVIRTRHPLPGFGEVFEGIDEIIGKKEDECKSKYDGFYDNVESYREDYDAYHHCDVDVYYSKSYKACIGESACNAGGAWGYIVTDLDKKELLYSCTEPGDDNCEENIEEIHNALK